MKLLSSASPVTRDQPPARRGLAATIRDWTANARRQLSFAVTATMGRTVAGSAVKLQRRKPGAAAAQQAQELADRVRRDFTLAKAAAGAVAAHKLDAWAWLAGHRKRNAATALQLSGQPARRPKAKAPSMTAAEREEYAMARRRERARCEAIITSPEGQANPVLARALAFEGRLPRSEALALMRGLSGGSDFDHLTKTSTARPMPVRHLGARNAGAVAPDTMAASWDRALQRSAGRAAH